jgi:hypothetical protein
VRKLNHRRDVLMTQGTTRLHRKHGGMVGGPCLFHDPFGAQRLARGVLGGAVDPAQARSRRPRAPLRPRHDRPAAGLAGPERGGYDMMKVLLIAPNVDATDVGEALMAFKWAEALSQRTHLTVLCFQRPGRPDVAGQLPRAHVVTWPEPPGR